MSYNQDRSNNFDNNFSSDPNNFGAGGAAGGTRPSDANRNNDPMSLPHEHGQGNIASRHNMDPSRDFSDGGNTGLTAGNTTYANVPGAGGDFGGVPSNFQQGNTTGSSTNDNWDQGNNAGSTGVGGGGMNNFDNQRATGIGADDDSFDRRGGQTGDSWNNDRDRGTDNRDDTKRSGPTMGDKLKGGMEKMAGRVTGNQNKVERGEERKLDGSNTNY